MPSSVPSTVQGFELSVGDSVARTDTPLVCCGGNMTRSSGLHRGGQRHSCSYCEAAVEVSASGRVTHVELPV
jgi:hypothetical protein